MVNEIPALSNNAPELLPVMAIDFKQSRISLNSFFRSGDEKHLKKSISSYIHNSGGASVIARQHVISVHVGTALIHSLSCSSKAIHEAISKGESIKEVLEQAIRGTELKRGILETENLVQIFESLIDEYIINFSEINEDGSNIPWEDFIVDFIVELIFRNYSQRIVIDKRGRLDERIQRIDRIKDYIEVCVRDKVGKIDIENMSHQILETTVNQYVTEVYQELEKDGDLNDW